MNDKIYPIGSEPKETKPKPRWIQDTSRDTVGELQEKAGQKKLDDLVAAKALKDFEQGNKVPDITVKVRVLPHQREAILKYAGMLRLNP